MSANIYWKPRCSSKGSISTSAPSGFISALETLFGPGPWIFGIDEIQILKGMESAYGKDTKPNPYSQILHVMEKYPTIEVWVEY